MSVHKDKNNKNKPYYVKYKNKTFRGFLSKNDAIVFESRLKMQDDDSSALFINMQTLAKEYLQYAKTSVSYGTYQKSKNLIDKVILPNIDNKRLIDFNERDCLKFRAFLNDLDYSTVYKNDVLQRFKTLFNYACKYYGLGKNPSIVIEKFRKNYEENLKDYNRRFNVWTEDEFYKFVSFIPTYQYKVFFSTLYFTGMRLGECLALNWKDLKNNTLSITKNITRKTDKGTYEIKSPKTKSSIRTITIDNNVMQLLNDYKQYEMNIPGFSDEWFIFGRIKPFAQTSIDRVKETAIKKSGVKRIRIHDLRHSFATNLINKDVNVVAVSKTLGHSSITQTLNTYTHLLEKTNDDMIAKLEASSQNLLKIFSNTNNIK